MLINILGRIFGFNKEVKIGAIFWIRKKDKTTLKHKEKKGKNTIKRETVDILLKGTLTIKQILETKKLGDHYSDP